MLRAVVLAVVVALVAARALAADIYTGAIGSAQVVVLLKRNGAAVEGRYAYRSVGHPITLAGAESGGALDLRETIEDGPEAAEPVVSGLWRLTPQGSTLTGTWRARPGGPARRVTLTRIASTPPDPTDPPPGWTGRTVSASDERPGWMVEDMPFLLEVARAPVRHGPEQILGAGAFRMVTDPRSGVAWPQLTRFPDAAAMQRLNEALEENRALGIAEAWSCADSRMALEGRRGNPDVPTVQVTHLGRRLLVLNISGSLFCGGAHPSNFSFHATYDTGTGRLFETPRLLRLETEAEQAAFRRFWVERFVAARRAGRTTYPAECPDPADPESGVTVDYRVTTQGLAVTYVSNATVDAACAEDLAVIPLPDLSPFLRPGAAEYWR